MRRISQWLTNTQSARSTTSGCIYNTLALRSPARQRKYKRKRERKREKGRKSGLLKKNLGLSRSRRNRTEHRVGRRGRDRAESREKERGRLSTHVFSIRCTVVRYPSCRAPCRGWITQVDRGRYFAREHNFRNERLHFRYPTFYLTKFRKKPR